MTFDSVALTSRWIAADRAVESRRADRLFEDQFGEVLAGEEGFELLRRISLVSRPPGVPQDFENPYLAIRTRFIDDFIRETLARGEIRQIVFVAAGLDSRPFRMKWPSGCRVFELDRPEVLHYKDQVLDENSARPKCDRVTVSVDLTTSFGDLLVEKGFEPSQTSLWIVEGLLPYLNEEDVHLLLERCTMLAIEGSMLVADFAGKSFLNSIMAQPMLKELAAIGAPWRFGSDDPEGLFATHGWNANATRPGEDGANYGRWPFPVPPRGTPGAPQSFFVTARRE